MITADRLRELMSLKAEGLTQLIQEQGYKGDRFTSAMFTGITNAGQFCYHCVYPVDDGTDSTKVFLTIDHTTGKVTADY